MVAKTYYISKDRQYIFDRYYIKSSTLLCDNVVRVEVYAPIEKIQEWDRRVFFWCVNVDMQFYFGMTIVW